MAFCRWQQVKEREEAVVEQEAIIHEETAAVAALTEDQDAKKREVDKANAEKQSFVRFGLNKET